MATGPIGPMGAEGKGGHLHGNEAYWGVTMARRPMGSIELMGPMGSMGSVGAEAKWGCLHGYGAYRAYGTYGVYGA